MAVVDGPADEVIPEQHGHLEVGLLSRHVRRHGRPERPSPENHHLARGLEDVAAVVAAPGEGAHHAATVPAGGPA